MTEFPPVQALDTMKAAWAERDRLWTEAACLRAKGALVVVLTAETLYGKDVQINWENRTVAGAQKETHGTL